ncbi:acyltransferase family protein [Pseudothauera lacus]|uniref:Acyltransferase 3 domain-containing protein n=1 Tax=Pseudothauera lacus TaxID=2136175 RepID=A0A2T4IG72_9RHOO|nr:acyltransferase [Pseudothauera lacus]PTD96765.1 hypothetical protein C8261_08095 [Pseudothauera lacus]
MTDAVVKAPAVASGVDARARPYLGYLHNFRGFAITLIIATHCVSIFDWSASPLLETVLKRLVANGTILFLFIAGFLFQHLSAKYEFRDYLWKKTRFVVFPYLFTSLPAIVLFTAVMVRPEVPQGLYDAPVWQQVGIFLLTGSHLAPFWFIPTVVLFYLASPLLHWLDRKPWFYALLPAALLIPVFVPRGSFDPLQSFIHFFPVWMLGMACSHYRATATNWLEKGFWPLGLAFMVFLMLEMTYAQGTHSWYSTVGKIVLTLYLFELFRRWGSGSRRFFELAGTLSFGLFFVHSYVISVSKLAVDRFAGGPPAGSLVGYLLSLVLAVLVSVAVVRMGKWMLGRYSRMALGV